jgi:hypothetical protein
MACFGGAPYSSKCINKLLESVAISASFSLKENLRLRA